MPRIERLPRGISRYIAYRKRLYKNVYSLRIQIWPHLKNRRGRGIPYEIVRKIREEYGPCHLARQRGPKPPGTPTQRSLAEKYGISRSAISLILSGTTYRNI